MPENSPRKMKCKSCGMIRPEACNCNSVKLTLNKKGVAFSEIRDETIRSQTSSSDDKLHDGFSTSVSGDVRICTPANTPESVNNADCKMCIKVRDQINSLLNDIERIRIEPEQMLCRRCKNLRIKPTSCKQCNEIATEFTKTSSEYKIKCRKEKNLYWLQKVKYKLTVIISSKMVCTHLRDDEDTSTIDELERLIQELSAHFDSAFNLPRRTMEITEFPSSKKGDETSSLTRKEKLDQIIEESSALEKTELEKTQREAQFRKLINEPFDIKIKDETKGKEKIKDTDEDKGGRKDEDETQEVGEKRDKKKKSLRGAIDIEEKTEEDETLAKTGERKQSAKQIEEKAKKDEKVFKPTRDKREREEKYEKASKLTTEKGKRDAKATKTGKGVSGKEAEKEKVEQPKRDREQQAEKGEGKRRGEKGQEKVFSKDEEKRKEGSGKGKKEDEVGYKTAKGEKGKKGSQKDRGAEADQKEGKAKKKEVEGGVTTAKDDKALGKKSRQKDGGAEADQKEGKAKKKEVEGSVKTSKDDKSFGKTGRQKDGGAEADQKEGKAKKKEVEGGVKTAKDDKALGKKGRQKDGGAEADQKEGKGVNEEDNKGKRGRPKDGGPETDQKEGKGKKKEDEGGVKTDKDDKAPGKKGRQKDGGAEADQKGKGINEDDDKGKKGRPKDGGPETDHKEGKAKKKEDGGGDKTTKDDKAPGNKNRQKDGGAEADQKEKEIKIKDEADQKEGKTKNKEDEEGDNAGKDDKTPGKKGRQKDVEAEADKKGKGKKVAYEGGDKAGKDVKAPGKKSKQKDGGADDDQNEGDTSKGENSEAAPSKKVTVNAIDDSDITKSLKAYLAQGPMLAHMLEKKHSADKKLSKASRLKRKRFTLPAALTGITAVTDSCDISSDLDQFSKDSSRKPIYDHVKWFIKGNEILSLPRKKKAEVKTRKVLPKALKERFHFRLRKKVSEQVKSDTDGPYVTSHAYFKYQLSNPDFIDNGITILPTKKTMRVMFVFALIPTYKDKNWFDRHKDEILYYSTGEILAEVNENGDGTWYYKNGATALRYYKTEGSRLPSHRCVVYSSGEKDDYGRKRPITVLASFDTMGNGIVFDHWGKVRLKYNQTEGMVIDDKIGPPGHWKWHFMNDVDDAFVEIYEDIPHEEEEKPDEPQQLEKDKRYDIEFKNFMRVKSMKVTSEYRPLQIRFKAFKLNDEFALHIVDQANIYIMFRKGSISMKFELGMLLNTKEILYTEMNNVDKVFTPYDLDIPAKTESINHVRTIVAGTKRRISRIKEITLRPRPV